MITNAGQAKLQGGVQPNAVAIRLLDTGAECLLGVMQVDCPERDLRRDDLITFARSGLSSATEDGRGYVYIDAIYFSYNEYGMGGRAAGLEKFVSPSSSGSIMQIDTHSQEEMMMVFQQLQNFGKAYHPVLFSGEVVVNGTWEEHQNVQRIYGMGSVASQLIAGQTGSVITIETPTKRYKYTRAGGVFMLTDLQWMPHS